MTLAGNTLRIPKVLKWGTTTLPEKARTTTLQLYYMVLGSHALSNSDLSYPCDATRGNRPEESVSRSSVIRRRVLQTHILPILPFCQFLIISTIYYLSVNDEDDPHSSLALRNRLLVQGPYATARGESMYSRSHSSKLTWTTTNQPADRWRSGAVCPQFRQEEVSRKPASQAGPLAVPWCAANGTSAT